MSETKFTAFPNASFPLITNTESSGHKKHRGNKPDTFVWTVTNAVLCVWSLIILYQMMLTSQKPTERRYGHQLYLIWNFSTTLVYCVEVGWTMMTMTMNSNNNRSGRNASATAWCSLLDCIELLVAIYFLLESAHLLIKWKVKGHIDEELLDVIISSLAYLGQSVRTGRSWYCGQGGEEIINHHHFIV